MNSNAGRDRDLLNLALVIANAEPGLEPASGAIAILDGETEVLLVAALERVGVIQIGEQPRELVRLDRLEVDVATLRWTQKLDLTAMQKVKLQTMQRRRERTVTTKARTAK